MLTLEQVLDHWKKDCEIDDLELDRSSRETPKLHAKYIDLLSQAKLQKQRKEMEFKKLLKDKFMWYNGKMDKTMMDEKGWDYDPFDGLTKPLKSDMDYFYESDPQIQALQSQIEYWKTMIDTLSDIVSNITWRHQTISNMIKWRQFTSGV
jgi:hypothetical protein